MMNDYYKVGEPDSPVCSNSSLSAINPQEGGSIIKFRGFFAEREEEQTSLSLTRGKLIHKYQEAPDKFIVDEGEKPTDMMAGLLERTIQLADAFRNNVFASDVDISITSNNKVEKTKQADIAEIRARYEQLGNFLGFSTDDIIRIFRTARVEKNAYRSRTEAGLLTEILEGEKEAAYMKFLKESKGKIILTKVEKEKVVNAIQAITLHPKVSALLGIRSDDFESTTLDGLTGQRYKELPIYWSDEAKTLDDQGAERKYRVNCKALLDNLLVNHQTKIITYTDLKSTGYPIALYQEAMEKYKTYRQIAVYRRAVAKWFQATFPDKNLFDYKFFAYVVPVETFGNYQTCIYDMSERWILKGTNEFKSLLSRVGWHYSAGEMRYSFEEVKSNHILKFTEPTSLLA